MKVDLIVGSMLACISWSLGFGVNSLWMIVAAFLPDLDIPWNEFWRIFIKKEKKFSFSTLLDEHSYTHKFWFHNPLVTLPTVFFVAHWYQGYLFAAMIVITVFVHFVHDTVDHNFDGIRWFWPFNWTSFKWSTYGWHLQDAASLRMDALKKSRNSRTTSEILKDNI